LKINPLLWSASCLNSQHAQPIHPLRIEDNPRSASNQDAAECGKLFVEFGGALRQNYH